MAFNISNLFSNLSNSQLNTTVNESQNVNSNGQINNSNSSTVAQNSKAVIEMLKSMLEGDILSGTVTNIENDNVTLQLGNGEKLLAHLTDNSSIQTGQNMTFLLENNMSDTIALKPLMQESQQLYMISNALEAANYPATKENVNIVKELINMNMPVDVDTISEAIKNAVRFPDADINTIANLMKLDIPVTQENIEQFEAYKSYEHSIMGEINNFSSDLSSAVSNLISENGYEDGLNLLENTINSLYNNSVNSEEASQLESQVASQDINTFMDNNEINQLATNISNTLGNSAEQIVNDIKNGNISTKDVLTRLNGLLSGADKEAVSNLINSKEYSCLLKQMTAETMMITAQNVAQQDGIKNFYKRLKKSVDTISQNAKAAAAESPLAKSMGEIKSNIDFMNDLNKNMTFVQMPVKFTESTGNGDLYVFTNKKALQNGADKISALLHLDMDNLGPMDIYVNLAGKNVSTNFCLESEEMLDFVYANIDKLNARLEALGYNAEFKMKLSKDNEENVDFVDDFINKDNPPMKISQYVFDIKA